LNQYHSLYNKYFSNIYFKNIIGSGVFKLITVLIGFLFVPLLIDFLDKNNYGLWITISSFLGWFGVFDLGVGNGLRNKLTQAISNDDQNLAKVYVSTAYFFMTVIFGIILIIFSIASYLINWKAVFNSNELGADNLTVVVILLFSSFCIQAILKLILIVFTSVHKIAWVEGINAGIQAILFFVVFIFNFYFEGSLLVLSIIFSVVPVLLYILASIYFYTFKFNFLRPNLKFANFDQFNDVITLGFKFFILQISALVMFATDNMLIAHFFSPKDVTLYNIPFKYFSIITIGFSVILNTYWGAITSSAAKNDQKYIVNISSKLIKVWSFVFLIGVLMVLLSQWFFRIWIGNSVEVPLKLTMVCFVYVIIMAWSNMFSSVANAYSKIKLQILIAVMLMVLNIPICYVLIHYFDFGVEAMPLGGILCMSIGAIVSPIQAHKLIYQKATGLWNG
jgi:O-antigen/teichoic acid export membrane protein